MATKQRVSREAEIRKEVSEAVGRAHSDERATAILRVLEDLREQGVQRAKYDLASPYERGPALCGMLAESEEQD